MSSTSVSIRLSSATWTRYSLEARGRGVGLATHLRDRLEEQDRTLVDLAIRAATELSGTAQGQARTSTPLPDSGTLVEVLLLLRSLAGPQKSAVAQKEIERRGLSSWK